MLNDKITTMHKSTQYTYKYTVSANAQVGITANQLGYSGAPSGYKVCAIVGIGTGSSAVVLQQISPANTGSNNVAIVRNVTGSSVSATLWVTIGFIKNI